MSKWIFLALVVLALWYGYRWYERTKRIRAEERGRVRAGAAPASRTSEDMRQCPACGVYIAADAAPCARPDCPQRARRA
ncbi:hypothetical protein [Arenibaculum pallidiluteum]|uniref:hypothetical protein n=1 Tax=Arenibaculum pallidiluteum TaxID=2812559 RepID=UPI001A964E22|nr:hypothetical protein [Arenibaculum pallidiluteum]